MAHLRIAYMMLQIGMLSITNVAAGKIDNILSLWIRYFFFHAGAARDSLNLTSKCTALVVLHLKMIPHLFSVLLAIFMVYGPKQPTPVE